MGSLDGLERSVLAAALDRLTNLPALLRQTVADHQWAQIPLMVKEHNTNAVQAAGVPLEIRRQLDGLVVITSVTASLPTGGGTITLGDVTLTLPAGVTTIAPIQFLLTSSDRRLITPTAQGAVSMLLTGTQLSTTGQLSG